MSSNGEEKTNEERLIEKAKMYWYLSSIKNSIEDLVAELRSQIIELAKIENKTEILVTESGILKIETVIVNKFDEKKFKQAHPSIHTLFKTEQVQTKLIKEPFVH
jgi:hypothetical protein